jgi:hypothetical protein
VTRTPALPAAAAALVLAALAAPAAAQVPGGLPAFGQPPAYPVPGARETEAKLDAAKAQDAGRRLEWVWIDAHGGFEQVGLVTLGGTQQQLTGGKVPTSASGGVVGAGVGVRLLYLTLLVRGRIGVSAIGQLYRVGLEAGFHVPLGRVEPHVELGGGYAALGGLPAMLAIQGGYGRLGAGLDYFVAPVFSIGADVSAEILGTHRSAAASVAGDAGASALGGTVAVTAVLGLHF